MQKTLAHHVCRQDRHTIMTMLPGSNISGQIGIVNCTTDFRSQFRHLLPRNVAKFYIVYK